MASELCSKAGLSPSTKLTSVTEEEWQLVHAAWTQWVRVLQNGKFSPTAAPPPDCSVSVIGGHVNGTPGSALLLVDNYYRMPEVKANRSNALHETNTTQSFAGGLEPAGLFDYTRQVLCEMNCFFWRAAKRM